MLIYLASRYSRYPEMQKVRDELAAMGHQVTSRWINGSHEMKDGVSTQAEERERIRFANEDLYDLTSAHCVIAFTEEPRSGNSRGGRHVEFGYALAQGKRCIVVGFRENVFYCLERVEFHETWESAKRSLELRPGV